MTEETIIYIVDWDIPEHPANRRLAFYRALSKLKRTLGVTGKMSTQSVLMTSDRNLAEQVHFLASQYGKSNFYTAIKEG